MLIFYNIVTTVVALHVRLEKNPLNDDVRPIIRWQSTNDFVLSLGWVHDNTQSAD